MTDPKSTQPEQQVAHKLVNRLTLRNWRSASVIRFMLGTGYFRVSVVGNRYFDRGAGGFMGPGEWVYEGRVICSTYPEAVEDCIRSPAIKSKAGWSYEGEVQTASGDTVLVSDRSSSKRVAEALNREFWSIDEALAYANGEDAGLLADISLPVKVTRTKAGYRLTMQKP